jgi:hypothetical protein
MIKIDKILAKLNKKEQTVTNFSNKGRDRKITVLTNVRRKMESYKYIHTQKLSSLDGMNPILKN